ncbi:hypothetical protein, partial [Janthinobacterium sp.]|uniref:hypothetical protein n=1 Tax=Janthinobacterium sp. TaxID=1871054 RepID=UPI00293D1E53
ARAAAPPRAGGMADLVMLRAAPPRRTRRVASRADNGGPNSKVNLRANNTAWPILLGKNS